MTTQGRKFLPNFLCVGLEKCGTTTLYDLLKQHSLIGLSSHKETHFFNSNWDQGIDWYCKKFSHCSEQHLAIGEITPAYHRCAEVIPRIQQTLGKETKIVLMLREPRQRAFSHYIHDFAQHQEITNLVYKRYLATTAYAPVLKNYFEAFGKENCLTLIFEEDVLPNQQVLVDKVCQFLKIPSAKIKIVHSNPSCLPIAVESPDYPCKLHFTEGEISVAANSLLIYTGQKNSSKVLTHISASEKEHWIQRLQNAISIIPALKSAIIYEQNVEQDLLQVEKLLGRELPIWKKPLEDLHARFATIPQLVPA